ncbi:transcriptional activator domain-containing protein [Streptomyces viridochromogenes DSM 40736]|uniref:Transcriptional activator domain-containing protein n=1 Tax=Streptomyces viridochromogenes (strain DSM 40736 / JCM 4977 / BCRC 1201 / Tue 494) TaxID=591159 RepID=D9X2L2_STRVT|nr:BTAD domain-containing putative transcriptional regulator [Streptomyces viridochromogenes]EFL33681.1 transcriptional activator domain-containing protein [Streptomyces viridochromogenes DSM 40736]
MLFEILGQLRVRGNAEVGSPTRRALLTALLLRTDQSIGMSELAELLWDEPPASATANIRSHLTGLRRDLELAMPGLSRRIRTYRGAQSGYGLHSTPDQLDLSSFMLAARRGRTLLAHGDADGAVATLEHALALWRGPFGQDLPPTRWFDTHTAGLNGARFDAYEDLFTACILANKSEMLSYRIESVIAEMPYRQRLWELLAAVRCIDGDVAGALTVIKRCRVLFADELGLDLPPDVDAMQTAALSWDREQALRLIAVRASAFSSHRHSAPERTTMPGSHAGC